MDIRELKHFLIQKGILTNNGKRKARWKHFFTEECSIQFSLFSKNYRSEGEAWYCLTHNIKEPPKCQICGAPAKFVGRNIGFNTVCEKCSANAVQSKKDNIKQKISQRTKEEKDEIINKRKSTNLTKHGDENYNNKEKIESTCLERYGTKSYSQTEECKTKVSSTIKEKYGKNNIFEVIKRNPKEMWSTKHDSILEKRKQTNVEKYGMEYPFTSKECQEKKQENISNFCNENNCSLRNHLIKKYGQGWLTLGLPTFKHNGNTYIKNEYLNEIINYAPKWEISSSSEMESDIANFIKDELGIEIKRNVRDIIPPLEVDIFIPEKSIAIEFNGNFWHSAYYKSPDYHLNKTKLLESKGIRCIHIFEFEWILNQEKIKSFLSSVLSPTARIFARECQLRQVTQTEEKYFLDTYHLQGYVPSQFNMGLFFNGELVELATFGHPRFSKDNETELLRLCTKSNVTVVGGFSKILKHVPFTNITTYVDRAKFDGKGYFKTGFTFDSETPPSYVYYRDGKVLSRYQCQKKKLPLFLKNFDPTKTETENMYQNRFVKIYNCGNLKLKHKQ